MRFKEDQIVPYEAMPLPAEAGPWMVFAPHADDESLGMGGTLLKAAVAGIETDLVVMTDGALGGSLDDLAAVRQAEARAAAHRLGLREPRFLGLPDRGIACSEERVREIADIMQAAAPRAVFFPGVFELHPDHRAAAVLVWQALRQLTGRQCLAVSYEVAVQGPINCLVDITAQAPGKEQAIACYRSQLEQLDYGQVARALNQLRALTLPPASKCAEGFYRYRAEDLERELGEVALSWTAKLFAQ